MNRITQLIIYTLDGKALHNLTINNNVSDITDTSGTSGSSYTVVFNNNTVRKFRNFLFEAIYAKEE